MTLRVLLTNHEHIYHTEVNLYRATLISQIPYLSQTWRMFDNEHIRRHTLYDDLTIQTSCFHFTKPFEISRLFKW